MHPDTDEGGARPEPDAMGAGRFGSRNGLPGSREVWAAIREADRVEAERVGPFRSWAWVYRTVVLYGILMIGLLIVLSRILDQASVP